MKYKMIALDLDGTLKTSENTIAPKTKEALIKCQEMGIKVVLASGRPTPGLRHEAKELELEKYGGYILSFNGARVHDYQTGEVIYEKTLTVEQAHEMLDRAKEFELAAMTYLDQDLITDLSTDSYVIGEAKLNDMGLRQIDEMKEFVNFPINKVLLAKDPEYIASVLEDFKGPYEDTLSIYRSAPHYIEIMAQNIDKAASLDHLLKHVGITPDELIAFGDGYNDLSMIEFAGTGVAMSNGVDEVKQRANKVTLSNNEDGIAYMLSQLIEGIEF